MNRWHVLIGQWPVVVLSALFGIETTIIVREGGDDDQFESTYIQTYIHTYIITYIINKSTVGNTGTYNLSN